jgi:hypothetical protein
MGRRPSGYTSGYTILETLIFIAVSAMMFLSAVILIGGRQQEVEFSQGIRDLESKLNDTLNDVSVGYFPANNSLNCTIATGASAAVFPSISAVGGGGQGSSDGCIFVGKVLQFAPLVGGSTLNSQIYIHTLAGRKFNASGGFTKNLDEANVVTITPTSSAPSIPNLTEIYELKWKIKVTGVYVGGTNYGSLGVVSTFGTVAGSGFASGSQTIAVGAVPSTSVGQTVDGAVSAVRGITTLTSDQPMIICLADSADKQKASITIGELGNPTGVKLKVDDREAICT